ncbi:YchJ family protein [Mycobacterium camsae]|uniref:YchJ family protein n=1 Tax=Mycobacterium gordonae TaxID=1778 RepID=UPI00197FEC8B|nr:YchJ family protein [Mycobacterium gordonae]
MGVKRRDPHACPCGSGSSYADCCRPLHAGERDAGTALALMRSRFSAFALADTAYLLASWHPGTRPKRLPVDTDVEWRRLQIVDTEAGADADTTGVVEFRAQYVRHGVRSILHERSRFTRVKGRWVYVDGDVLD